MTRFAPYLSIKGRRLQLTEYNNFVSNGDDMLTPNSVTVEVTAAEMLALNATPKTLVAAPGAGRVLVPVGALFFLDYNSAAYAGIATGEDMAIRYTNGSGAVAATVETTGFLDQTADQLRWLNAGATPAATAGGLTPVANAALVLHMTTGEITTGDSPLFVRTYYVNLPATLTA